MTDQDRKLLCHVAAATLTSAVVAHITAQIADSKGEDTLAVDAWEVHKIWLFSVDATG